MTNDECASHDVSFTAQIQQKSLLTMKMSLLT